MFTYIFLKGEDEIETIGCNDVPSIEVLDELVDWKNPGPGIDEIEIKPLDITVLEQELQTNSVKIQVKFYFKKKLVKIDWITIQKFNNLNEMSPYITHKLSRKNKTFVEGVSRRPFIHLNIH